MLPENLRSILLEQADSLVAAVPRPEGEVWASELIPLLESLRFLESEAPKLLSPNRARGPVGLAFRGLRSEIHRKPIGTVLVIGPFNYPLFLPASQCLQALAAGNRVIWKPGRGGGPVAERMREILIEAGLDPSRIKVTDESIEAGTEALKSGVDLVIFTGSAKAAKAVAKLAADHLTPCILEASGCDSMFVLEDADLDRAAKALWFGLTINHGQTCISPRRIFVHRGILQTFLEKLDQYAPENPPKTLPIPVLDQATELIEETRTECPASLRIFHGAPPSNGQMPATIIGPLDSPKYKICQADLFAPLCAIISFADPAKLPSLDQACPYALGSSIFGSEIAARSLASQLQAGCITINDLIAPTADPRISFGGNRLSGYGRTRGAAGLLACTTEQAIITRRSKFLPHIETGGLQHTSLFRQLAQLSHAPKLRQRLQALWHLIRSREK